MNFRDLEPDCASCGCGCTSKECAARLKKLGGMAAHRLSSVYNENP